MAVMDIEAKIRSRIEAILVNDARNSAEVQSMAVAEEPMEVDPFAEERNLYQRIISSYRLAVGEVNNLLEENVGFLSSLCRVVDTIKEKESLQEICLQIADCLIQDLGVEYCGMVFYAANGKEDESLYVEGIREQRKLLLTHGHPTLLGSREFAQAVRGLVGDSDEAVSIDDVYRETRLNTIDFPGVVRALFCAPIRVRGDQVGLLILSHSLPRFFNQNHARVLGILASLIAHIHLLTYSSRSAAGGAIRTQPAPAAAWHEGVLSLILVTLDNTAPPRKPAADGALLHRVRRALACALEAHESILAYDECSLLVLLPGTGEDRLPARSARLQGVFDDWKSGQGEDARGLRLSLGYSACENAEDLNRTLEAASLMMRMDPEEADPDAIPAS